MSFAEDLTVPEGPEDRGGPAGWGHPSHVGPYHVIRLIGEGGMGVVYLAEQKEPLRRLVALKMMKPGLDTKEVIGRFEAERQALAVMDHPNIAKVLDAGASESGRPFFVMEYVKGVPFTEYCDTQRLTTRDRLELFVTVCHAVQHAHQKGVIHRDLKPSNILVTEQDGLPSPKVIDFGIAKALNWRLSEKTFATQLGRQMGTPAYMSPEQWEATGLDVDTRADVYSLGVTLYELLVGRLPVDPEVLLRAGPAAALLLHESAPLTPSAQLGGRRQSRDAIADFRATDPKDLRREVAGDLDWIVMRAMDADRRRRYQTAQELADDIGRYLRSEPILARPPTALYKASRFVRRHRIGTSASALVVLLGAGFTGFTVMQAHRLAREKARAEVAAARAEAFGGFLQAALLSPDPIDGLGRDATMLQVLDSAVARLTRQPPAVPAVDAAVRSDIGWAYYKLGLYDRAEPLLRRALELQRLDGATDSAALAQGLLRVGAAYEKRGKNDSAAMLYREALTLRRRQDSGADPRLAEALVTSGNFWRDRGDTAAARQQLSEALGISRRSGDSAGIATAEDNLGALEYAVGNLDAAARYFSSGLAYRRGRYGEHPLVAGALSNLGAVLEDLGRVAEAESAYREALRIGERSLGPNHDIVTAMLSNLGLLLSRTGRVPEAETLLRRALRTDELYLGRENSAVGVDATNLGGLQCRHGSPAEGAVMTRRALVIMSRDYGPTSWQAANAKVILGRCLWRLRQLSEAERLVTEGLGDLERGLGVSSWRVDSAKVLLSDIRRSTRRRG